MSTAKGHLYETEAVRRLENSGYTILERNYNTRYGEIDIIASNEKYRVFAEVKERKLGAQVAAIYT